MSYPVHFSVERPERSSRWLALATLLFFIPKMVMLIPHLVILYVLGFAAMFAVVIAQVAVLFTGRYPQALFEFVVGVFRWQNRMNAYLIGLADSYPPFRLNS